MADPNFIAGTAFISLDGKRLRLAGEFSVQPSTATRETLTGMDGVHGYKQKPAAGKISAKLRDGADVSVTALGNVTNGTVTVELANGKTWSGAGMWCTEQPTVDAEEGTIDWKLEGASVTEI